jgi:hypothetical protein
VLHRNGSDGFEKETVQFTIPRSLPLGGTHVEQIQRVPQLTGDRQKPGPEPQSIIC